MAEVPPDVKGKTTNAPTAGDYTVIVGKQAVQTEAVYTGMGKAAAVVSTTAKLTPVFESVARRAPLIGAVISAGQALNEIGTDLKESKYAKAGVATVAGAVEVVGNLFGFGVGDSAREMVRGAAIAVGGETVAIEKSDLRNATETVGNSFAIAKNKEEAERQRTREAVRAFTGDPFPIKLGPEPKTTDILLALHKPGFKPPKR